MPTIPEQITSAVKANAEAQYALNAALSEKVFERLEELTRLNIDVVKASLAESMANAKELLHASNPQEFFSSSAAHVKRESQSAVFYGSEVTRILSATQAEFNKAAAEKSAAASRNGTTLLSELTKNVPIGAEQLGEFLKSACERAGDAFAKKAGDGDATAVKEDPSADAAHQASRKKSNEQSVRTTH